AALIFVLLKPLSPPKKPYSMPEQKRLFLLDAYALIFRGYYALMKNPRINSKGMDTSAILGFVNSLLDVIKRERPDHLAVAFDNGGSVERSELYGAYKANRDVTPDAIRIAVPYIQEILKAMNIPVVELPGYEADDLIGTLAKQAEKEDYQVFMVTPDKDFGQLVSDNIFMHRPARLGNGIEIWGIPEVQERFGVERPEQVIDYLGMMGDASDNIPGLPGVGDKTAKKFLADFGSLEGLLANTDKLSGKMKEKVEENAELGRLSRKLAEIKVDCDVTFKAEDYEMSRPNTEKVYEIFEELEFRRLKEQFFKTFHGEPGAVAATTATTAATQGAKVAGSGQFTLFGGDPGEAGATIKEPTGHKSLADVTHFYQLVVPGMAFEVFNKALMQQDRVCFDTETTSLNPLEAELVGIAFSWAAGKGHYVSFPQDRAQAMELLEKLRPFFESEKIEKIGQNLKYDIKVLLGHGMEVKGKLFDTMLAHYLINPDMRHSMDVLAETYLNYAPMPITELIGKKGKNQLNMRQVPLEKQTEYAVEDADITFQLAQHFAPELKESKTDKLFEEIEIPLLRVLADMEREGIRLDESSLKELCLGLDRDLKALEAKIYEQAGEIFNIASPKQLGDILFEKLKLVDKPKKTKTGQYSTAEDVLSYLSKDHEIVKNVLEYRGLAKLKSTYVDTLPLEVQKHSGRIHTDYMQTVAATGRLSSNNPNLQNIPIRTQRGRQIRKAFVPRDRDHLLLSADYSQIELRIIAAL